MQAQLSELPKMFCKISEAVNVNKRVKQCTGVSFLDSKGFRKSRCIKKGRINKKRSHRRNNLKTSLTYNTRAQNEKYNKHFSNKVLSYNKVKLLSRGLKFIPTPPVHSVASSNKSLFKDFNNFARTMCLRYMFADKRKALAHPFHVKSTWQPPVQNSVALERYLPSP